MNPSLGAGAIRTLRAADGAEVLGQNDPGYESGRRAWNGMIDMSPAVIVRPRTAAGHDPHNVFHRNQNVRPSPTVGSSAS